LTGRARWHFYAAVKAIYAPEVRGLQHNKTHCPSSLEAAKLSVTLSLIWRRLLPILFLLVASAITVLPPAFSRPIERSLGEGGLIPPLALARLVPSGLKDWSGESKPPFNLEQLQGGQRQLSHSDSDIVLVHFFATWCASCHEEMTSLQKLAGQLSDKAVMILAIDVADMDLRARRYFEINPVDFPVLLDRDRKTAAAWDVYSLPMTFILDKSRKPKYVAEASLDWSRPDVVEFIDTLAESR
jgi:thiol-disulfide isomerase/thioredoxin